MNKDEILERLAKSSNIKEDLIEVIDNLDLENDETLKEEDIEFLKEVKKLYSSELLEIYNVTKQNIIELDKLKETIKMP